MRKAMVLLLVLAAVFGCKKGEVQKEAGDHPSLGSEKPKVLVVTFVDYQCPNSAKWVSVLRDILKEFPGDVRVELRNNPLDIHADAEAAAAAVLAAQRQGKFSEYYPKLFKNQTRLSAFDLLKYAEDSGLNLESFKNDKNSEAIKKIIVRDRKIAVALGIQGTPFSFVNGRSIIGAYPFERFKKIIEEEIKKYDELKGKGIAEQEIIPSLGAERNSLYDRLITRKEEPPEILREEKKTIIPEAVFKVEVRDDDPYYGNRLAPVTIVEFGSYLCPWTVKSDAMISALFAEYKGGELRFVYKQNPLDIQKDAHIFSEAALAAASQGKFWEFHRILFRNAENLKPENLLSYAREAGLDLDAFKEAIEKRRFYERVEEDRDSAALAGAKGTPNFFINGRKIVGLRNIEEFKAVIDEELKKAKAKLASGIQIEKFYDTIMETGMVIKPLEDREFKFDFSSSTSLEWKPTKETPHAQAKRAELTLFTDFNVPGNLRIMKFLVDFIATFNQPIVIYLKMAPLEKGEREAEAVAKAVFCAAEQGKLLNLLGGLFNTTPPHDMALLNRIAEENDMDRAAFTACVYSDRYLRFIRRDAIEAQNAGITSTPVLFINGRRFNPFLGWDAENLGRAIRRFASARDI